MRFDRSWYVELVALIVACAAVGCVLAKPTAHAVADVAFAECLARAETEAEVLACTAGRDLTHEAINRLLAAKRVGMARVSGYRNAYEGP